MYQISLHFSLLIAPLLTSQGQLYSYNASIVWLLRFADLQWVIILSVIEFLALVMNVNNDTDPLPFERQPLFICFFLSS
jgi:hypothetical protein